MLRHSTAAGLRTQQVARALRRAGVPHRLAAIAFGSLPGGAPRDGADGGINNYIPTKKAIDLLKLTGRIRPDEYNCKNRHD
jgi:hypothetical protein